MRVVLLNEYATTPDVYLSPQNRDTLRELVPSLRLAPSAGSSDRFDCTPGSVIGTVTLDDLQVIIRPKLTIESVFFLISYSLDPSRWRDTLAPLGSSATLVEALIPAFLHHATAAIQRGLHRDYVTTDDSLNTVRGRIRFGDQLARRYGKVPPIEVTFDDYTEDIIENQLLSTATDHLLRLRIRNRVLQRELQGLRREFVGVSRLASPGLLHQIHWTRLNSHYRAAAALAELVLNRGGLQLEEGRAPGTSFLVNMNNVFEDFVYHALREQLRLDERSFPQGCSGRNLYLDQGGVVTLEPDLSWWNGNDCVFIGDAKYKRTADGAGKNADLYQLLAYLTAAGLDEGVLIYAAGEAEPTTHEVRLAGKRLRIVTLNLAGQPEEVLEELADVADYIDDLAGSSAWSSSKAS